MTPIKKIKIRCTPSTKLITYDLGDTPCWKYSLQINKEEKLKIYFKVTDKDSEDLYEHGYQELLRFRSVQSLILKPVKNVDNIGVHFVQKGIPTEL